jgi:hypothetical protein
MFVNIGQWQAVNKKPEGILKISYFPKKKKLIQKYL